MNRHGLQVEELNPAELQQWYDVMTSGHKLVVGEGKWVDDDLFRKFVSALEGLR